MECMESLVFEVLDCLPSFLNLEDLLCCRSLSRVWLERIDKAEAGWRSCCVMRFGAQVRRDPLGWWESFKGFREDERQATSAWCSGNVLRKDMFVFSSYVRSWASDDSILIAGLFNGHLQPLDWNSGVVGRPFSGRHEDEVTCIDLSSDYVLSGSGDPGYYNRPANDASVQLRCRNDGKLLGRLDVHDDSVRAVVLLPCFKHALSGGLDGKVNLLSLSPFACTDALELQGPCRSLCVVEPYWKMSSVFEVRVLASSGCHVSELAVRLSSSASTPTIENLRSIRIDSDSPVSGISYSICPSLWERTSEGKLPKCLLAETAFILAGGTVNGGIWSYVGQAQSDSNCLKHYQLIPKARNAGSTEVVSIEIIDRHHFLAICRMGVLALIDFGGPQQSMVVKWMMQGFRMYVSTIGCREPTLLVSDGFDNCVCTLHATIAAD